MTNSIFGDRLQRIRETAELREIAPNSEPNSTRAHASQDTPDDTNGAFLEIALMFIALGQGALFFFDIELALKVALFSVPALVVFGVLLLRRRMRNGAADTFEAGLDLFDIFKSVAGWLK